MLFRSRWWRLVSLVRPLVDSAEDRSIHDPTARAASRGYGVLPARLLPQLAALVRAARADLPHVHTPTRVVQSREDNRVTVAGTEEALRLFGSSALEVVWRSGAGHVVSVDSGHEDVWALTAEWIERQVVAERLHSA